LNKSKTKTDTRQTDGWTGAMRLPTDGRIKLIHRHIDIVVCKVLYSIYVAGVMAIVKHHADESARLQPASWLVPYRDRDSRWNEQFEL